MGLDEELPNEPQFQTLAGFVLSQLGHIPVAGERFDYEGFSFEVMDMDGARVDKVLVTGSSTARNDAGSE
ncbi:Transporter associated domain protein [compost metagenome]